jgi:hypothetical protein
MERSGTLRSADLVLLDATSLLWYQASQQVRQNVLCTGCCCYLVLRKHDLAVSSAALYRQHHCCTSINSVLQISDLPSANYPSSVRHFR